MGCVHSSAKEHGVARQQRGGRTQHIDRVFQKDVGNSVVRNKDASLAASPCVSPSESLNFCSSVVKEHNFSDVDRVMLAAIAMIESGGHTAQRVEREDIGEFAYGLCQMLLSTARWLALEKGYAAYGSPCQSDLLDPPKCLYFCAAYLQVLSSYGGEQQSQEYVVKAYHSGPKEVASRAASLYWEKFTKARGLLQKLQDALDAPSAGGQNLMHVVQPGEGLQRIAAVCGVTVEDILTANPDLPSASDIHPHDCIALPVSQILPSIYIVQPGDSLSSIATAHRTTPSRILAWNSECRDLTKLQPGWALEMPGLKGSSDTSTVTDRHPATRLGATMHRHAAAASLEDVLVTLEPDSTAANTPPYIVSLY